LGGDGASEPQLLALQSLAEAIIATDKTAASLSSIRPPSTSPAVPPPPRSASS